MSYILDALRKADAERERAAAPGLHTQPVAARSPPSGSGGPGAARSLSPLWWLATVPIAGAAWWWFGTSVSPSPAPVARIAAGAPAPPVPPGLQPNAAAAEPQRQPGAVAPAPQAQAQVQAQAQAPQPQPWQPQPQPQPQSQPQPSAATPMLPPLVPLSAATVPAARVNLPARSPAASAASARPRPPRPIPLPKELTADAPVSTGSTRPATSKPMPTAPAGAEVGKPLETRLPTRDELPEALRRELPQLTAGGAMYSENPANRLLVVNGQVLREGDSVAAGLVLEQIRLKSAVLNFRGQRYTISY